MTNFDTAVDEASPSVSPSERRTTTRYRCRHDLPCRLIVIRRNMALWAKALDISTEGVSFLVSAPLEQGLLILLRLRGGSGTALTLMAEVIHATMQPDGNWMVGCRFDSATGDLTPEERLCLREVFQQPGPESAVDSGQIPTELAVKLVYHFPPVT